MLLDLDLIRLDGATQPRAELLTDVMEEYAEQMRNGVEFPPITVFFDGTDYWLADGFHRVGAALRARPSKPIEADVIQGTQSEAQWFSFGANKAHGLRRTNEDKARAVKSALGHPGSSGLSDGAIAEHVGVHRNTVQRMRREIKPVAQEQESDLHKLCKSKSRKGRDGRTINTAKIGTARKGKADSERKPATKPSRHMASRIHAPTRAPSPVEKMTTVTLPHNPVMGARTLIEVFDVNYLRNLVTELTNHLQGIES